MIGLKGYREFWEKTAHCIPHVTGVMPVTVDEEMAKKIKSLPLGSITLFWIPPNGEGAGLNLDNYREKNLCVVFVMKKYDPLRKGAYEVLEETQRVIEEVKSQIKSFCGRGCSPWRLSDNKIVTIPETKFFASFAGWSISFTIEDAWME